MLSYLFAIPCIEFFSLRDRVFKCEKSLSVSGSEGVAVIQATIGGVCERGGKNDSEVIFCMCLEGKTRRIREVLAVESEQKKGVKDGPSARWSPRPLGQGRV